MITPETAKFRGPTASMTNTDGSAFEDFECADEPRLVRRTHGDGRVVYLVDGKEAGEIDEACKALAPKET